MSKGIILGIDLSKDNTQIAYLDNETPRSICVGTRDNFLIPTIVCYNSDLDEWTAGDEAVNKSALPGSTIYKDFQKMVEEKSENWEKVFSTFISYILKLAVNYCNGSLVKNILITVEDVKPEFVWGVEEVLESLGYDRERVRVISHAESFIYYILNQNKDIWVNNVYYINFDEDRCIFRRLNVTKGRGPHVAGVELADWSDKFNLEDVKRNPELVDEKLSVFMDIKLKEHIVSSVFLSGQGFYLADWPKTIDVLCRNRRVFKGNNLIVKGATYGAREFFMTPVLDEYLISCKGRTKVKISLAVKYRGQDSNVTLSNVGDYWYQVKSSVECLVDTPTEAVFEVYDVMTSKSTEFEVDLAKLPDRPSKCTRIEVKFEYVEENKIAVEIRDLGFGEFFKASDVVLRKEVSIHG